HADPADRRVEQLRILGPAAAFRLAGRKEQLELQNMIADRADLEIVLAMDVHGRRAAERREHGPGDDRRPPAVLDGVLPELLDRHARLALDDAGLRVPLEDSRHASQVEAEVLGAQRSVAIAAAGAAETDLQAAL